MCSAELMRRWMMVGVVVALIGGWLIGESPRVQAAPPLSPEACPCSLWPFEPPVNNANANDGPPIEVGVKFKSSVDGYITALRYYKGSLNPGDVVGHLWAGDGTLLATVSFGEGTPSGWQQANLSEPIFIVADVVYVASYYSPSGYFAETSGYFVSTYTNAPLTAPATGGQSDPNGVYRYGSSGFPTSGSNYNYWADVVFDTTIGPDTTPPTVTSVTPANNATDVSVLTTLTVQFNEGMAADTLTASNLELRNAANQLVAATLTYNSVLYRVTIDPTSPLAYSTAYTLTIKGGPGGVTDLAGNPLAADVTSTFATQGLPPDSGPGGPILVIANALNPFGRYYGEILQAEGLNSFLVTDISLVTPVRLADYDVAILAEMSLTAPQVAMLSDWVMAGGNLIAMRPDAQLSDLLGLIPAGASQSNAYLLIDTTAGRPGYGLVAETIQYHGEADFYTLNGGAALATLYSDAATPTSYPAVTLRSVGSAGGQAAAFTYDLARSVVYTRQGNPAWAGQNRDADWLIRSIDLFFGNAPFDPQPDWIDLSKVAIPQADEQQRLLVNLIQYMNLARKPLPRFWYFPRNEKAVVVMTSDDHGGGATADRFDSFVAASPSGCSVDDWECVRATSFIYPNPHMTDAMAAAYTAQGFEVALHVDTSCSNYTPISLENFYATQLSAFAAEYPSLSPQVSNRTHCVAWSDWSTQAKVELNHGIRLDTNYYAISYPSAWVAAAPGVFTGSGMPMRFADQNGQIIDVYQATTYLDDEWDESGVTPAQDISAWITALLDRALGPQGYFGAFTVNMHSDSSASPGAAGAATIVAAAQARDVPIISARQLLSWLDGRNASYFTDMQWSGSTLNFDVLLAANTTGIRAMLPTTAAPGELTALTRGGNPVAYTVQTIKGLSYAVFDPAAGSGTFAATYGGLSAATYAEAGGACGGQTPCYSALQTAIDNTADGGTVTVIGTHTVGATLSAGARRVTLRGAGNNLPVINWTGGAGLLFNVGLGNLTLKGLTIQSGGSGTLFGTAGGGQLLAYANHIGSGFTSICSGAGCGAALLGHNWWGTSTYASQPAGLNTASWNRRLGAPIVQWGEGGGSVSLADTFGAMQVSGGSGPVAVVSHGATSPFFAATQPDICSHFFDVFALPGAAGTWSVALPIDTSICSAAPTRVAYMPAAKLSNSSCDTAAAGCWAGWSPVTRVGDQFVAQEVSTAMLNGTPFVSGSATGTNPTAIGLADFAARSASGTPAVIGLGAALSGLGLIVVVWRRWRGRTNARRSA